MSTLATIFWGALAAGAAAEAFIRPSRALVSAGRVLSCEGPSRFGPCDPTVRLETPKGAPCFAAGSGRVLAVGRSFLHILLDNEPTVLFYDGLSPTVREGASIARGQAIGLSSGTLAFGVWDVPSGLKPVPPSAWLATHGIGLATTYVGPRSTW
jgi:hypothetical protein